MNNEESIYTLKNMAFLDGESGHEKTEEAIKMAISALESIESLKNERDAAVKSLADVRLCRDCKHHAVSIGNMPCRLCSLSGAYDSWEWRGII